MTVRRVALAAIAALMAFGTSVFAGPFTPGNIVIYRVGDGSAALAATATAVFLDEYTPAGTLVQSIAMPVSGQQLTASGSATSEGFLTRSTDGAFIVLAGYAANAGTAAVAGTSASTVK